MLHWPLDSSLHPLKGPVQLRGGASRGRFLVLLGRGKIDLNSSSRSFQLFLTSEEPLQSPSTPRRTFLLDSLRASRQKYVQLLAEKMRAPDGSYEEGFVIPGTLGSPRRQSKATWNLETNNPLSLHREVRWVAIFPDNRIHATIESVEGMVCFYRATEDYSTRCGAHVRCTPFPCGATLC
jgi:hypothetical protein